MFSSAVLISSSETLEKLQYGAASTPPLEKVASGAQELAAPERSLVERIRNFHIDTVCIVA